MQAKNTLKKPAVSIIGCGWLGLPLAQRLVEEQYHVNGSTTTEVKLKLLQEAGIQPFLLDLGKESTDTQLAEFLKAECLVINIPPGTKRNNGEAHIFQIKKLLFLAKNSTIKKLIFISSTSVYPNVNRQVYEGDVTPMNQTGNMTLVEVEKLVLKNLDASPLVLRFGGLAGGSRLLVKHFAGKTNVPGGNVPVNLIHQEDAVEIIIQFIKQPTLQGIFNVCAPLHPLRNDLYSHDAQRYGLIPPSFNGGISDFKLVNTDKLKNSLNYTFKYPDPGTFPHHFTL